MTRIVVAVLAGLALSAPASAGGAGEPLLATVGDVTATSAVVWARAPRAGPVSLVLNPEDGALSPPAVGSATSGTDLTVKFPVTDLRPRTRYRYPIESGRDLVTGGFVTAPTPDDPAPVLFAWSGDLGGGGQRHGPDADPQHSGRLPIRLINQR